MPQHVSYPLKGRGAQNEVLAQCDETKRNMTKRNKMDACQLKFNISCHFCHAMLRLLTAYGEVIRMELHSFGHFQPKNIDGDLCEIDLTRLATRASPRPRIKRPPN